MKYKQFCFIDDVYEINNQSRCIISGPPCITWFYLSAVAIDNWNVSLTYQKYVWVKMHFKTVMTFFCYLSVRHHGNSDDNVFKEK